jgi:hypothetical protein
VGAGGGSGSGVRNMSGSVFGTSLAPGLGPWGGHPKGCRLPDRTGQGRVDAFSASIQVSRLLGERGRVRGDE